MSLLWIIVLVLVVIVWAITVADIIRQRYSGWTTAGWLALVILLPVVGSLIYTFTRKPTRAEAELQHLAESDRRRAAGARHVDGPGFGP